MMQHLQISDLSIYSFEANKIIMIHKATKALYQYYERQIYSLKQNNIFHNSLLSAIIIPTGLLYKRSITSLQIQLSKRIRMQNKQNAYFQQQQILNTFIPILECLQYIHSKNIQHQNITTENIQFNQQGQVILKDWLLQIHNNHYYQNQNINQRTQNQDIIAFGNIIFETITLTRFKDIKHNQINIEKAIKKVIQKYSKGLIIAVYIMTKKFNKYFQYLYKILNNTNEFIDKNTQLNNIYKKLKSSDKQYKPVISNLSLSNGVNINKNVQILSTTTNINTINYNIPKSPILIKKTPKIQDSQNKKQFNQPTQQYQKKNQQRMNRISQKNINFQTVKKQDMALKKMSNYKLNFNQDKDKQMCQKSFKKNNKDKQQMLKYSSPIKRLRTLPKKKNA